MESKYGHIPTVQLEQLKKQLQKSIFFMLLYVDPKTKNDYQNINVNEAFNSLQRKLGGVNAILCYPIELVNVMSYIESAWQEYNSENFNFRIYRKLILDAGSEIMHINGGIDND